ncbi:hypothetical protein [Bradyrhizobium japonicum]|nr:hypothetical protein [Bradyrhizobium japonicum]
MNKLSVPDLLETGIYTIPEVAELVQASQDVVRVWVEGHTGKQAAVIDNQLGRVGGKVAVSFTNLMELRFVATFANAGVGLREIRKIMDEAKETLEHPHPFATHTVFKTDGKKIIAEIAQRNGVSIYDLRTKNFEMLAVVMRSLKDDVTYDPRGDAISWRPRPTIAPNVIVHPHFSFGRPVLQASRIPTATLAQSVKVEGSAAFVADIFDVPERQVREAVKFEQELRKAA